MARPRKRKQSSDDMKPLLIAEEKKELTAEVREFCSMSYNRELKSGRLDLVRRILHLAEETDDLNAVVKAFQALSAAHAEAQALELLAVPTEASA